MIFQGLMFENKPQPGMTFGYRFLEKDYTLYAVLRKPGLPQGYSLKDMADDYAVMIREEFGGPVDVIGVSTGGSLALQFAADHPGLVQRLVIHSSAYRLGEAGKEVQLEVGRLVAQGKNAHAAAAMMGFMLPRSQILKTLLGPLVWLGSRIMSLGKPKNLSDLVVTIKAEDKFNFKDRLAEISAPTLVIAGSDDPFYTPALFRDTAEGIPNARLVLYENMGHPAGGKHFKQTTLAFLTM
jgi:pimeloyl-ACP methyl ester carboxylesterase